MIERPDEDRPSSEDAVEDPWQDAPTPSLFSRTWFRVTIILLVLGTVTAIAVPSVINTVSSRSRATVTTVPAPSTSVSTAPSPSAAVAESPAKPAVVPAPRSAPAATVSRATPAVAGAPVATTRAPVAAPRSEPTPTRAPSGTASVSDRNEYWVQVGAFRDADVAKQMAAKLRERDFRVVESTITRNGGVARRAVTTSERYEVVVGGSKDDLAARLAPRGLSVDPMKDGVRVRPMLPLRDAVALSKDLAGAGFKVQVKRAAAEVAVAPRAPEVADGVTWYRVRVGPFPDRAAAQETLQKLTDRGYTPYIAHGQD